MFCDQAKEYLSQKGIKFQERDIAQDPGALADLKKLGYMTSGEAGRLIEAANCDGSAG